MNNSDYKQEMTAKAELYPFYVGYFLDNQRYPTTRECGAFLGCSNSTAWNYLNLLVDAGWLSKDQKESVFKIVGVDVSVNWPDGEALAAVQAGWIEAEGQAQGQPLRDGGV